MRRMRWNKACSSSLSVCMYRCRNHNTSASNNQASNHDFKVALLYFERPTQPGHPSVGRHRKHHHNCKVQANN